MYIVQYSLDCIHLKLDNYLPARDCNKFFFLMTNKLAMTVDYCIIYRLGFFLVCKLENED